MPATVSHVLSATTPDDPSYEIRPSHWNSAHALTLDIVATEISGLFSNKNGVSFGLDGTNITGSIAAGGAPGSLSAGTTNFALGEIVFSNSNGVSFGLNGATVTAQHNGLTTAMASNRGSDFVQATAAFAGTSASGTIASNGISVSIGPYITTAMLSNAVTLSNIRVSAGTTSNLLSAITFDNANGITFGLNASTVTASHNGLTSQSNQALSGSNGSFTFQTATLGNLNGLSFYTSNGSMVGSYTVPSVPAQTNQTVGLYASSNTTLTSSGTVDARSVTFRGIGGISVGVSASEVLISGPQTVAQSNQTIGLYASSNTTLTSSGTADARSLSFRAVGAGSIGVSNNEVVVSFATAAGAPVNFSAGTTSNNLASVVFSNSNGVSFGLNGSTITGSVNAGGGGGTLSLYGVGNTTQNSSTSLEVTNVSFGGRGALTVGFSNGTIQLSAPASSSLVATSGLSISTNGSTISIGAINGSFYRQAGQITQAGTVQGNSLVSVQPFVLQRDMVFSNALIAGSFNVATAGNNSSAFQDVSVSGVVYTRNVSTLSSVFSFTNSLTRTWSSNASQTVTGVAGLSASFAQTTLSAGEYWIALHVSTTNTATGGANTTALTHAISMILAGSIGSAANAVKVWGGQTNASMALLGGQGIISTNATRASIAFSDLVVTGTRGFLAGIFFELRNGTFQI